MGRREPELGSDETSHAGSGSPDLALLLGLDTEVIAAATSRSAQTGASLENELVASGWLRESDLYRRMAGFLGIRFMDAINPEHVVIVPGLDSQLVRPLTLRLAMPDGHLLQAIVPQLAQLGQDRERLAAPDLAERLVVTSPSAIRHAVWQAGSQARIIEACNGLFDARPDASARIVLLGRQGFVAGLMLAAIGLLVGLWPDITLLAIHFVFSLFYLLALAFRFLALASAARSSTPAKLMGEESWPVYTVMVPLYREAAVIGQLVDRLKRLDWPASRLDIKIICEADDAGTRRALAAQELPPQFEIVVVPPGHPRTKPRALSYALAGARGEFLVVFDAEDRPHPEQLREAWQRFRSLPAHVACLQAPLLISNAGAGWVPALFALEYAALFRVLLPFLGRKGLPLPLGGTSNHFRMTALRACGAWDPFNVTEDADLGLRLHRTGYRTATLTRYTLEDAPTEIRPWLGQRSRWFKGWLQTWLVAMRRPVAFSREIGPAGFLAFHLMMTGMLVSALGHPALLVAIAWQAIQLLGGPLPDPLSLGLMALDACNILGAYAIFLLMGHVAMLPSERKKIGWRRLMVPLYWLMIAAGAWLAVFELPRKPFFWNKTEHRPAS